MCIACELGYLSMIDALEAERKALQEKAVPAAERFVCEPDAEPEVRERAVQSAQSVDEPRRD
jgi:hypothetical protein